MNSPSSYQTMRKLGVNTSVALFLLFYVEFASAASLMQGVTTQVGGIINDFTNPTVIGTKFLGFVNLGGMTVAGLALVASLTIIKIMMQSVKASMIELKKLSIGQMLADALVPFCITSSAVVGWTAMSAQLLPTAQWLITNLSPGGTTNANNGFLSLLGSIGNALDTTISNINFLNLPSVGQNVFIIIALIFALVFALWAIIEFCIAMMLGFYLLTIGACLGPLFIATAVHPFTKGFFDRWFGFMWGAILLGGIGHLAAKIAGSVVSQTASVASINAGGTLVMQDAVAIVVISLVLVKLMSSLPGIASALVPASLGVSNGANAGAAIAAMTVAAGALTAAIKTTVGAPAAIKAAIDKGADSANKGVSSTISAVSSMAQAASSAGSSIANAASGVARAAREVSTPPSPPPPKP
jgi:type IV secretory pathway VirB6-like protein